VRLRGRPDLPEQIDRLQAELQEYRTQPKEATTLNEYQERAHETSQNTMIGGNGWLYPAIGLANESGELLGKIKKIYRDNEGILSNTRRVEMAAELSDCLWYVAELATQIEVDLADIAAANLAKLADRANRGVIGGSGDER
jgi:NTP pyrophosphatase (non-canonical NTP hydrolase)